MFNIDFKKLGRRLIPPLMRKDRMRAWIESLLTPLRSLNDALLSFIDQARVELTYNGQTIQMQRLLNDIFDPTERRISIIHVDTERQFDYFRSEGQAVEYDYFISEGEAVRNISYRAEREASVLGADFQVNIPDELSGENDKITANVERYRLAGISYNINYY